MDEPLTVDFHRTAAPGRPELRETFQNLELSHDEQRAWLGTERPTPLPGARGSGVTYELTFRRGGERRRVVLGEASLTGQLRPLVDRLVRLCDSH
jgi:hypothetical protein